MIPPQFSISNSSSSIFDQNTGFLTQNVLTIAWFLPKYPQAPLAPLATFSRSVLKWHFYNFNQQWYFVYSKVSDYEWSFEEQPKCKLADQAFYINWSALVSNGFLKPLFADLGKRTFLSMIIWNSSFLTIIHSFSIVPKLLYDWHYLS